jgi:hypothetical protein
MFGKVADVIALDPMAFAIWPAFSDTPIHRCLGSKRNNPGPAPGNGEQASPGLHDKIQKQCGGAFSVRGSRMTFPEWTKPSIYGALAGAIAVSVIGFNWGGWVTTSNARTMARTLASDEVTLAMVPVCMNMSADDPQRAAKLAVIQEASGYSRRNAMMETGWATQPGADTPNRDLASACLAGLELDGS